MHNTSRLTFTSKKKKTFNSKFNHINNSNNNSSVQYSARQAFNHIFQSTTILSRSPSHSLAMTNYGNYGVQLSHAKNHSFSPRINSINNSMMSNNASSMMSNNNSFKSFPHKKSKSIKISNNNNKGHFMKHNNMQHNFNNNNNYNGFSNFNNAANQLANMLHSELTINTSFYNSHNNNYSQQQQIQQSNPVFNRVMKFGKGPKKNKNGKRIRRYGRQNWGPFFKPYVNRKYLGRYQQQQQDMMSQSLGAENQVSQRYVNRFKYIRPANVRNAAPYNTTQYIMFDYSKRRANDQECPNEVQQFADDWNMALANGANGLSSSLINTNNEALISLSHKLGEATSLGSSLSSSNGSTTVMLSSADNNTAVITDNFQQLSSSL